jgi:hypothetical protein
MSGFAGVLTPFGREQYSAAERDVSEEHVRQFPSARVKKLEAMLRRNIETINWILLSSTADGSWYIHVPHCPEDNATTSESIFLTDGCLLHCHYRMSARFAIHNATSL